MIRKERSANAGPIMGRGLGQGPRRRLGRAILAATTLAGSVMLAAGSGVAHAQQSIVTEQGQDFGTVAGSQPRPGTSTVPTWRDTFTDPTDGRQYSVTMVGGGDPRTPGAGTTTIPADIVPLDFAFTGPTNQAFNGSEDVPAVVGSPMFQDNDYSSFSDNPHEQYLDAIERSEFDQVGPSPFHLKLAPQVMPTLSLTVNAAHGQVLTYPSGLHYGCVDAYWLFDRIWEYIHVHQISPQSVPIFVMEYTRGGIMSKGACIPAYSGLHGAGNPGRGQGAYGAEVEGQTWMISTYEPAPIRPITPDHPYTYSNIDTLGHEIAEWAHDPYGLNTVQPYQFPNVVAGPTFCASIFETGDPVNQIEIRLPGNTYFQDRPGNDGTWWLQDEVLLPWFARQSPNVTSEPEASSGAGRYTFFGDRNDDPRFHAPAKSC
ncbi:MAG TPA: hypothetical protein VL337_14465 [Acidimicrobiales bacterium]|nr:hypothetical protein [Acidimicrobiales bacterium]